VVESEVAQRVRSFFAPEKIEIVTGDAPLKEQEGELSAADFDRSKRLLHLTEFKGQFFKRCPGARPGLTCCNYFVLNLGLQCNMNCSYCYLQSFINTPVMKIYTNIDKALSELTEIGRTASDQKLRVGTGEVIDSLSLDEITGYSQKLTTFFRDYPEWRLEFKTKSNKVDQFINEPHAGNVIVSWSINPQNVIASEEHCTASCEERLLAARKCADRSFKIAFHIDPVIYHEGWERNYSALVQRITELFKPEEIPYMSVGALRFQPEQRHMMRERFGLKSMVTSAEMFPGSDGKLRYDKTTRSEMFKYVVEEFHRRDKAWAIFLCMESPESWLSSMGASPKKVGGLDDLFDHQVTKKVNSAQENYSGF
jgi:spore photoproduct lyase